MEYAKLTRDGTAVILEDYKDGYVVQVIYDADTPDPIVGSTNFYTVWENAVIQFALKLNAQVMVMANCQSFDEEEAFIKRLKEA